MLWAILILSGSLTAVLLFAITKNTRGAGKLFKSGIRAKNQTTPGNPLQFFQSLPATAPGYLFSPPHFFCTRLSTGTKNIIPLPACFWKTVLY
jgi:hypothetical protein